MNSVSERFTHTNAEMVRSMLFNASTDYEDRSKFEPEAIAAAAYTRVQCPTTALSKHNSGALTPYNAWHKTTASVDHLHPF